MASEEDRHPFLGTMVRFEFLGGLVEIDLDASAFQLPVFRFAHSCIRTQFFSVEGQDIIDLKPGEHRVELRLVGEVIP